MSENKKIIDDIIEYIEISIQDGLEEANFIKNLREKIENYIEERLS
jgi:hypothetical protein